MTSGLTGDEDAGLLDGNEDLDLLVREDVELLDGDEDVELAVVFYFVRANFYSESLM